jgi:predicted enzyme related to lactoylglutathione lyase
VARAVLKLGRLLLTLPARYLRAATGENVMANVHGRFVWYELFTTDIRAAKNFYSKVVGWGLHDLHAGGYSHTMFTTGTTPIGGLMDLPEGAKTNNVPPGWVGYVGVNDVDATTKRFQAAGGNVYVEPHNIPYVGRFSLVTDPQRATIALFKPEIEPPEGAEPAPATPGRIGWHELHATDWQEAIAFYSDVFGWQKGEAHDMGAMGTYQLFSVAGVPIGGMFNKPPAVPMTLWTYYFNVDGVEQAAERVKAGGGEIANGPMEVPGGSWIVQCKDPESANFALMGKRN